MSSPNISAPSGAKTNLRCCEFILRLYPTVIKAVATGYNVTMRFLLIAGLVAVGVAILMLPHTTEAAPASSPPAASVQTAEQSQDVKPPVVTPQMKRYSRTRYALYFIGTAYELLVLWGVLALRLSAGLRDVTKQSLLGLPPLWYGILPRMPRRIQPFTTILARFLFQLLSLLVYYFLLALVLIAIHAPLTWYSGYYLEHAYGLSSQSVPAWIGDLVKGIGVDIATTVPILWLLFWLIQKSPRRWAFWFWGALIPLIAFGIFVAPLVIDPLFNKFTPLPPGPLRTRIEALAAKAGIPNAPVYVVDKSRQTHSTNAYVTGIGSSARIVLWDTTIQKMPQDQILAVVGHEMGHYVLKHLYWGFAMTVGGPAASAAAGAKVRRNLNHPLRPALGRHRPDGLRGDACPAADDGAVQFLPGPNHERRFP